ncbi:hypothetical protein [Spirosoma pomorum]
MSTLYTFFRPAGPFRIAFGLGLFVLFLSANACTSTKSGGTPKQVQLSVGDIKEITVPRRGDSSMQLIGTSDNQEVVDVSRRELAPAVDTLQRQPSGPTVFQLKGITAGTANVTFSEKRSDEVGNGKIIRTYVVRVTAQ